MKTTTTARTAVAKTFSRERLRPYADWLAVALAASLPWSTSVTSILVVLWLLAVLPTLTPADLRRELATPAGALPVLLWAAGTIGMLWADVSWAEKLHGLSGFHKLLLIPLLLAQFRQSDKGREVILAFLASCTALLALSWAGKFVPGLAFWPQKSIGVPVKDYISQSAMFTICIFVLAYVALDRWRAGRPGHCAGLTLLAIVFLANILFMATSRTALVVIPALLVLFGFVRFGWKGTAALLASLAVLVAVAWPAAPFLQVRVTTLFDEIRRYESSGQPTPAGERLEFWRKSLRFVAEAPVIGHGTGSIGEQFRRAAEGHSGMGAIVANNPHNQTLAVAIQMGIIGAVALWAMWLSHLMLFRGPGLAAWAGLVIVTQNVIGSLFNSHLFDFTHGWAYVVGMGIAGGIVLGRASGEASSETGTSRAQYSL